jgi:hypothetical protein
MDVVIEPYFFFCNAKMKEKRLDFMYRDKY